MKVGLVVMDENPADALRIVRAARTALAGGDVPGVIAAGEAMVDERAVFGTPDDVAAQLGRYADVVDWALLYPPHFGVDQERIHANELSLIDVAAAWAS
jgi:alkanesulfonate monooxygenase SsuD/methylene tetrahydromethanopterin reductase-like flavin-dependent oxidoreductase (luciferase family)